MSDDTSLIAFKAICNFINDLESEFGDKLKSLKLYKRLINHTQISHETAIKKHNSLFSNFCRVNRDAIYNKKHEELKDTKIEYSERIYLDVGTIFNLANAETTPIIWSHILTISAILDPTGRGYNDVPAPTRISPKL